MNDIYQGDCIEVRTVLANNSVDTIITDPPYGLEFMGKGWDRGVPGVEYWKEFLAVTKPGGMLLAFGGTRTYHRLACAIEDAGWEIRDCMMWLYGSGFPKSLDISKAIQKEFLCRYSKNVNAAAPLYQRFPVELSGERTDFVAVNAVIRHEVALGQSMGIGVEVVFNDQTDTSLFESTELIDSNTILSWKKELEELCAKTNKSITLTTLETITGLKIWSLPRSPNTLKNMRRFDGHGTALKPAWEPIIVAMKPTEGTFAQNAEKWGVAGINVGGGRIATSDKYSYPNGAGGNSFTVAGEIDGTRTTPVESNALGRWPANLLLDEDAAAMLDEQSGVTKSRASGYNFDPGAQDNPVKMRATNIKSGVHFEDSGGASRFFYCAKAGKSERGGSTHPTMKPIKLMEYLCTLTKTPTGGIVLDPFAGSGTTLLAAKNTGRQYVGIEKDEAYFKIIQARLGVKGPTEC